MMQGAHYHDVHTPPPYKHKNEKKHMVFYNLRPTLSGAFSIAQSAGQLGTAACFRLRL